MGFYRIPSKNSKYYLPKEEYLTAVHYALRYPYLLEELNTIANADTAQAITYDKEKVDSSNLSDSTAKTAIMRAELKDKIKKISEALTESTETEDEENYLRLHVCYGFNYWQLVAKGMKSGQYRFSNMRQYFYYALARKI